MNPTKAKALPIMMKMTFRESIQTLKSKL